MYEAREIGLESFFQCLCYCAARGEKTKENKTNNSDVGFWVLTANCFQLLDHQRSTSTCNKCFTCVFSHLMLTKFLTVYFVLSECRTCLSLVTTAYTVSDNNKCLRRQIGNKSLLSQPLSQDGHAACFRWNVETQMEAAKSQS